MRFDLQLGHLPGAKHRAIPEDGLIYAHILCIQEFNDANVMRTQSSGNCFSVISSNNSIPDLEAILAVKLSAPKGTHRKSVLQRAIYFLYFLLSNKSVQ
jgi:hypothetical protein